MLPDEIMTGRVSDDRVGFFTVAFEDIGSHEDPSVGDPVNPHPLESDKVDNGVRLIYRWNIEVDDNCNVKGAYDFPNNFCRL